MSISSEISRIEGNIADSYTAAAAKGAAMPETQNSANLPRTIQSIPAPDDYVVEEGTSGIWTYRKWASGAAECFGKSSFNLTLNTRWAEPIYYNSGGAQKESLPSGLFTSVDTCIFNVSGATGTDCWACNASGEPLSTSQTCGIYLVKVNSTSTQRTYYVSWHVTGRWD